MTLTQVIAVLQRKLAEHGDVEVVAGWESIYVRLSEPAIYFRPRTNQLILDVDDSPGDYQETTDVPPSKRQYRDPVDKTEDE